MQRIELRIIHVGIEIGQAILKALVAGQENPADLAHLARGSLIKKEEQLQAALQGKLTPHHRIQLEEPLQLIATLDHVIARFDREVAERLRRFDALIERMDAVTGLSRHSIEVLLGELGWEMASTKAEGNNKVGARGRAYAHVSGGTVSSDQRATGKQESSDGGGSQHLGDFLSHGQNRWTVPGERSGLLYDGQ